MLARLFPIDKMGTGARLGTVWISSYSVRYRRVCMARDSFLARVAGAAGAGASQRERVAGAAGSGVGGTH